MSALQQLPPYLKELRLSGRPPCGRRRSGLEARLEQASGEQWGYEEFLTRLLQEEVERRHQKQLELTLRRGNVTSTKTLETSGTLSVMLGVLRAGERTSGTCGGTASRGRSLPGLAAPGWP